MFRRRPRNGTVYAQPRLPSGTSYEAALEEAKCWGDRFPRAHVRLEIGDDRVIDVSFPMGRTAMATICREFFQGVWLGCLVIVAAVACTLVMLR